MSTKFTLNKKIISLTLIAVFCFIACQNNNVEPVAMLDSESAAPTEDYLESYPAPEPPLDTSLLESYPSPNSVPTPNNIIQIAPEEPDQCHVIWLNQNSNSEQDEIIDHPVFSPPQVIMTSTMDISVAEWLNDNQRLLISEGNGAFSKISLLDVTTGKTVEYAQRRDISTSTPIWIDGQNGVLFADTTPDGWVLRFSDGLNTMTVAENLASTHLAKPFLSQQTAMLYSSEPGALKSIDDQNFTIEVLNESTSEINQPIIPLSTTDSHRLAWSFDMQWIAQYYSEQLYLIDLATEKVCALELQDYGEAGKSRIGYAQWSPNSRYLAMAVTDQTTATQLAILDILTMEIQSISFSPEVVGWPPAYVNGFTWSPNSSSLIVKVGLGHQDNTSQFGLFFVDLDSNDYVRILSDYTFLGTGYDIIWSSDGSKIAYRCPTLNNGQICILEVQQ